jgi:hypothetical protein
MRRSEPEALTRPAAEGEAMGFDYLAFSDHIVILPISKRDIPIPTRVSFRRERAAADTSN